MEINLFGHEEKERQKVPLVPIASSTNPLRCCKIDIILQKALQVKKKKDASNPSPNNETMDSKEPSLFPL